MLGLSLPGEFAARCPGPADTTHAACCSRHVGCTLCRAPSEISLLFVASQVVEGLYLGNIRGECLSLLHLRLAVGSPGQLAGLEEPLSSGGSLCLLLAGDLSIF